MLYSWKGQYDRAIEQYEKGIRLKPDYALARYNLGVVYDKKGSYDQAIKQFKAAIRLKDDYALAHYKLGRVYADRGLYDLARKHVEQALLIEPDFVKADKELDWLYLLTSGQIIPQSQYTMPTIQPTGGKVYHLMNSREFHRPSCSIIGSETNLGEFISRNEALTSGAIPCKLCNP
jgi:tetratricopeptide (TPR) repeat protein